MISLIDWHNKPYILMAAAAMALWLGAAVCPGSIMSREITPVGSHLMGMGHKLQGGWCATGLLSNPAVIDEFLENTRRVNPALYDEVIALRKAGALQRTTAIGDSARFYSFNLKDKTFFTFSARLVRQGSKSNIWAALESLDANHVTDTEIDAVYNILETSTPADPNRGVVAYETEFFGNAPNIDGDSKVDVILLDIRDGALAGGAYIAGYFTAVDQRRENEFSNEKDILYVDTFPGIYNGLRRTSENAIQTVAHEYQHLVHYNYDDSEENWVNEGLSTYAEILTGFEPSAYADYLAETDRPLNDMVTETDGIINNDVIKDYHKVQLWTLYLAEQFGVSFIRDLTQSPRKGKSGVIDAARKQQAGIEFNTIFQNWVLANFINNRSQNGSWGYILPDLTGIPPLPKVDYYNYPIAVANGSLRGLSYEYIKFSSADSLKATFTAGAPGLRFLAIERGEDMVNVWEIASGVEYRLDAFGSMIKNVVVAVINLGDETAGYTINANAVRTLLVQEQTWDDGTPDIFSGNASFLGFGDNLPGWGWAVRFTPPAPSAKLIGASLHMYGSAAARFELHVWSATAFGNPGQDKMTPILVDAPSNGETWVEVDLSPYQDQLTNFSGDYFIGAVQTSGEGIFLGVDDSHPQDDRTMGLFGPGSATPGWYDLRDLQVSDVGQSDTTVQVLDRFNMMIRARTSVDVRAVPPSIPDGVTVLAMLDGIQIDWRASSEVDVTAYSLHRALTSDFTPDSVNRVALLEHPVSQYTDASVNPGVVYFYMLIARDIDGFSSEPSPVANAQVSLPGERLRDDQTQVLWHCNEGSGTIVYDETPAGIDGAFNALQWAPGRYGTALAFDGRFSGLDAGPAGIGGIGTSFTVELWYKFESGFETADRTFITQGQGRFTKGKWAVYYDAVTGKLTALLEANASGGGLQRILQSENGVDAGRWHHMALVRNHTTDEAALFVDGVLQDVTDFPGSLSLIAESVSFQTLVGRDARVLDWVPRSNFLGLIDDVRISKSVRTFEDIDVVTGVEDHTGSQQLPRDFALHQNYPNPFNPETRIAFDLPRSADVRLDVYDILGRKVQTLIRETRAAGRYVVTWDGRDGNGRTLASGVYFTRLEAGTFTSVRKMLLIK